ncbi:MAG: ATP-binding cassette domain-containing protein [Phycisphaerae bacterium]|nr:ATP-binding cassette domain-containing protein [Phycisphaerae bacterium]
MQNNTEISGYTTIVNCNKISFRRGEKDILQDISWKIQQGQNWALLGANGSGKTTFLKIITGYEWPTSGTVSVLGNIYGRCDLREVRKMIGWVSFNISSNIPNNDTAIEIVVSGLEASMGLYREYSQDEYNRALSALNMLSAANFANQSYVTLSQGEQQKTLIARALVNKPKLLVLDEPCSGLDPAAKELFLKDIENLVSHHDAPGIIFVTHHIDEIREWITNVFIIKDGQKLADGHTGNVLSNEILSQAFNCNCKVLNDNNNYSLKIDKI